MEGGSVRGKITANGSGVIHFESVTLDPRYMDEILANVAVSFLGPFFVRAVEAGKVSLKLTRSTEEIRINEFSTPLHVVEGWYLEVNEWQGYHFRLEATLDDGSHYEMEL